MASGTEVVAAVEGHCKAIFMTFMTCKLIMVHCLFLSDHRVYVVVSLSFSLHFLLCCVY